MNRYLPLVLIASVAVLFGSPEPASARHHGAHVVVAPGESGPRVGPSYLYPDPTLTPGATNPDITQANVRQTICNPQWSTRSIRPSVTYTNTLRPNSSPPFDTPTRPRRITRKIISSLSNSGATQQMKRTFGPNRGARPQLH